MTEVLLLVLAMALVAACGGFVAAEFSFITVGRASVEAQAARGDAGAAGVLTALRSLSTQLSAAQVGITVTNLGIGFLAEPAIAALLREPLVDAGLSPSTATPAAVVIALVLATSVTMIFGELIPKNLAIARPMQTARAVQRFQRGFTHSSAWIVRFCNDTANAILRRLGVEPQEELASARSAEELHALVRHSAKNGTLPRQTAELVERSLAFGERRAHDAMTSRGQFSALTPRTSIAEMVTLAGASGHSRFPVLDVLDGREHAVGVAHVRAGLATPFDRRAHVPVTVVMQPPLLVPDTVPLDDLMDALRASGPQMALVVNEFGELTGLVTLEDLVEEIVGEVRDEHDEHDEHAHREPDGTWLLPGLLRPDEASDVLGVAVPESEDYDTLAGLVALHLGRLAHVGDRVRVASRHLPGEPDRTVDLEVVALDGHRISALRARTPDDRPAATDGGRDDE